MDAKETRETRLACLDRAVTLAISPVAKISPAQVVHQATEFLDFVVGPKRQTPPPKKRLSPEVNMAKVEQAVVDLKRAAETPLYLTEPLIARGDMSLVA